MSGDCVIRCGDGQCYTETPADAAELPELLATMIARLNAGDSWAEARIGTDPIVQIRVERITEKKGGGE